MQTETQWQKDQAKDGEEVVVTKGAEVATKGVNEEATITRAQEAEEGMEPAAGMEAASLRDQAHSHPDQ